MEHETGGSSASLRRDPAALSTSVPQPLSLVLVETKEPPGISEVQADRIPTLEVLQCATALFYSRSLSLDWGRAAKPRRQLCKSVHL